MQSESVIEIRDAHVDETVKVRAFRLLELLGDGDELIVSEFGEEIVFQWVFAGIFCWVGRELQVKQIGIENGPLRQRRLEPWTSCLAPCPNQAAPVFTETLPDVDAAARRLKYLFGE